MKGVRAPWCGTSGYAMSGHGQPERGGRERGNQDTAQHAPGSRARPTEQELLDLLEDVQKHGGAWDGCYCATLGTRQGTARQGGIMEILHWLMRHLKKPHHPHPGHKPLKKFTFVLVNVDRDLTITAVGRRIGHHGHGRN